MAIVSLAVAAWCLAWTARGRGLAVAHLGALALVELLALVHVGYGVAELARGHRPHEYGTFIGYLVAFPLIIPFGYLLARLEPSRWGPAIAGVACLVDAVLVLRLHQVWTGVG